MTAIPSASRAVRCAMLAGTALALCSAAQAMARDEAPSAGADVDAGESNGAIIVTGAKTTRSATAISEVEIQKILPGVSPLKAIQTLPGVLYITADPWGNNEQNAQIFVHGFAGNQLG